MFQCDSTLFVYCRTDEILSGTDWHITGRRFIDYMSHCRMQYVTDHEQQIWNCTRRTHDGGQSA
jgi:hypothetical protein